MELSRDGWSCIKCYFADRPVFPNLRNLRWQLVEADFEIGSVVHFLSPSLRTLEFSCRNTSRNAVAQQSLDTWSDRLRLVMDDISTRVPQLAKLSLSYSGSLTAAQFLTPLSLTSHPFLRHLTLEGSPDKALEFPDIVILSRIPQLESLMLNGGHHASQGISNPSESGHTQSQHVEFPRLRSLHFLNYYSALNPLDEWITSATLQSLQFDQYSFFNAPNVRQNCDTWTRAFPSLRSFTCTFTYWNTIRGTGGLPLANEHESISALFSPLLGVSGMRRASFGIANIPVVVDDNDIVAFSQSWPSLEALSITTRPYRGDSPRITVGLSSLLSLARNCPHLASLNLKSLNIDSVALSQLPSSTPKQYILRTLQVHNDLEPAVHRLLADKVFPNLSCEP
ncbi:hypothetical protein NUW54_g13089 [Trametes sanguinea]|uniref:Uncharacterized protein n=1 Tax=Trametes sanguinea TaxID=158606 RepID=A0ACC1MQU3_9APHY|nr:hypothetical protein NUW54_g13089 [Trametes sanguinea]